MISDRLHDINNQRSTITRDTYQYFILSMHIFRYYLLLQCFLLAPLNIMAHNYQKLQKDLENLALDTSAKIGIAVIINSKDTIIINNEIKYPLMSVFKFHQSLATAHLLNKQHHSLDTILQIKRQEIKENTYSPLRDRYPLGDLSITVKDLLKYTLLLSDNNACDILFNHIIDVNAVDHYIRSLTTSPFSIKATEEDMHNNPQLCYSNWSSPLATAELIEQLLYHKLFSNEYRTFIIDTMLACETGKNRLPAFRHSQGTRIGHKTGTGGKNTRGEIIGVNDIGFVTLPDGQHYSIVVFIKDSTETLEHTENKIALISNMVYTAVSTL